jgi:glycosyltransferase involved in cell wall biosynthesis
MSKRIPVLHPITRLIIGGAQENTILTAQLLDPARWAVDVICGPQTGSEGSLMDVARDAGVSLAVESSLVRQISPYNDLRALWRLTRWMRRQDYAIVHTHSSKAGILGRWAAKWAGVPIIVHTVHGWAHHERQHPLVRFFYIWLERLTLPITDAMIAVSPADVEKGVADGIGTPACYCVIRSGIELDRFGHPQVAREETRAAWNIPSEAIVIGTVTRLSPQKAPLDFVISAAEVVRRYPDVFFLMVGDGPLRAEVEALAEQRGIADRLVLTGLRRDIPELMAAFDIFVLSSLWEGLPRVLPQAMASGLPIVATAADGSAEAVDHGVNGYLTPPGDPASLSVAILRLLDEPTLRQQMGEAGRSRVEEFGAGRMVAQIETLYEKLLAENRSIQNG